MCPFDSDNDDASEDDAVTPSRLAQLSAKASGRASDLAVSTSATVRPGILAHMGPCICKLTMTLYTCRRCESMFTRSPATSCSLATLPGRSQLPICRPSARCQRMRWVVLALHEAWISDPAILQLQAVCCITFMPCCVAGKAFAVARQNGTPGRQPSGSPAEVTCP